MQKLEKISIFIKKFFRKLLCYIYVFLLLYLTIIFILNYELYFIHIFNDTVSQPMPPSLFDYVQNQWTLGRALISRFLFIRPVIYNKSWDYAQGGQFRHIYPNRNEDEELAKWGWYDFEHFRRTFYYVNILHYNGRVVYDPHCWDWSRGSRKKYRKDYKQTIYTLYAFSYREIDCIWHRAVTDSWELVLFHKYFHNVFEFPFAMIDKYIVSPLLRLLVDPAVSFFSTVNLKWDFIYRLPLADDNCDSLFMVPAAKTLVSIWDYFAFIYHHVWLHDIQFIFYRRCRRYFSDFVMLFNIYIICCDLIGLNWGDIYRNLSVESIIYCLTCTVNFFSYLLFNFFSLFYFDFFLNHGFEWIFLENFLSLFFSYFFSIFLFNTVLNKYFWIDLVRFLKDLWFFWNEIIVVFFIILFFRILYVGFLPLIFLKNIFIKCLSRDILFKIYTFKLKCIKKYFWYKNILLDRNDDAFWIEFCTK